MEEITTGDGRTVLFVSHNMASVKNLCTRAIVLDTGTIAFDGNVEEAINYYLKSSEIDADSVSLKNRTDRNGGENFRFIDCSIIDSKGLQQDNLLSGEKYEFKINYSLQLATNNIAIRLRFIDSQGVIRFLCNNYISDDYFHLDETQDSSISCIIPDFPLPNGSFSIQLTAVSNDGIIDDVEIAKKFKVIGGDFYNSGKEQISSMGVLVKNTFLIN